MQCTADEDAKNYLSKTAGNEINFKILQNVQTPLSYHSVENDKN